MVPLASVTAATVSLLVVRLSVPPLTRTGAESDSVLVACPSTSVPAVTVVPPENVLLPLSVVMLAPICVTPNEPPLSPMLPEIAIGALVVAALAPVLATASDDTLALSGLLLASVPGGLVPLP